MSFTDQVKQELAAELPKKPCCRRALLLAILAMRGDVDRDGAVRVSLEGDLLFTLTATLVSDQLHRESRRLPRKGTVASEELVFSSPSAVEWLRSLEHFLPDAPFPEKCPSCRRYFLSGMFLAAGHVTDPQKAYQLEFACGARRAYAEAVLSSFGLSPKYTDRRAERLLYFRDSTAIEEVFGHMGAMHSFFTLTNSKIEAEIRNDANRRANCDANNIQKSIAVSAPQVELIERLIREKKISSLPPDLEATAHLRLAYPTLSLGQLAAMSDMPMTKSGLNHRLKRLTELGHKLLGDDENQENGGA